MKSGEKKNERKESSFVTAAVRRGREWVKEGAEKEAGYSGGI